MIKQKLHVTLNPTRKIRTKTKRPKFLSIRLELSPEKTRNSGQMSAAAAPNDHQQLNLFPLHPEDRDTQDDNNVEYFFSGSDGGATSLTGLLCDRSVSSCGEDNNETPSSVTYAYGSAQDSELERTALRNRERDASEEVKWVCYSEVVERKDEEVSSCDADVRYYNGNQTRMRRQLSLKLDYEEIINAWSDKGPLYIHVDSPQTVPQLPDHFLDHDDHNYNGERQMGLWAVPEMSNSSGSSSIKLIKDEDCSLPLNNGNGSSRLGGEEWKKLGQREASVLRYKEKRHNRLFAKKIRYQVRKLNAEKRPRIKGRFVKRS